MATRAALFLESFADKYIPKFGMATSGVDDGIVANKFHQGKIYSIRREIGGFVFYIQGNVIPHPEYERYKQLDVAFIRKGDDYAHHRQVPTEDVKVGFAIIRDSMGFVNSLLRIDPKIVEIVFSADADEESRVKLYKKMSDVMANRLGWTWSYERVMGSFLYSIQKPRKR